MSSISSKSNSPQSSLTGGLVVVMSSPSVVINHDAWVFQIAATNIGGFPATLTIKDNQASPLFLLHSFGISGHKTVVFNFPEGVKMIGGITWNAGNSNVIHAEIMGFHA